jgi:FkbM family methyltransferase
MSDVERQTTKKMTLSLSLLSLVVLLLSLAPPSLGAGLDDLVAAWIANKGDLWAARSLADHLYAADQVPRACRTACTSLIQFSRGSSELSSFAEDAEPFLELMMRVCPETEFAVVDKALDTFFGLLLPRHQALMRSSIEGVRAVHAEIKFRAGAIADGVLAAQDAMVLGEGLRLRRTAASLAPSPAHAKDLLEPYATGGFNRLSVTRHGVMLFNRGDQIVGASLGQFGEWSWDEAELFGRILGPGSVAVDGGAHCGTLTLAMADLVKGAGEVWAFEPQRFVFQTLAANVALNSAVNVHTVHAALGRKGAKPLTVQLTSPALSFNWGSLSYAKAPQGPIGRSEKVPVVAIDDLPLSRLDLVKLDVEGMEADALRGAGEMIKKHKPALYIETNIDSAEQWRLGDPAVEALAEVHKLKMGYQCHWHTHPVDAALNGDKRTRGFYKSDKGRFTIFVPILNVICIDPQNRTHQAAIAKDNHTAGVVDLLDPHPPPRQQQKQEL